MTAEYPASGRRTEIPGSGQNSVMKDARYKSIPRKIFRVAAGVRGRGTGPGEAESARFGKLHNFFEKFLYKFPADAEKKVVFRLQPRGRV